jgi:cell division protein FtsL
MNQINDIEQEVPEQDEVKKPKSFLLTYIRPFLDGSFFSQDSIEKNFRFIIYIIVLIILFISNTFRAQDTQRRIEKTKDETQAIRIKSIYMKSMLMESTRPTKMAEMVKDLGLKRSDVPPYKIER